MLLRRSARLVGFNACNDSAFWTDGLRSERRDGCGGRLASIVSQAQSMCAVVDVRLCEPSIQLVSSIFPADRIDGVVQITNGGQSHVPAALLDSALQGLVLEPSKAGPGGPRPDHDPRRRSGKRAAIVSPVPG